ncbi:MAG: hypothetical protein ACOVOV_17855 [Dolichospermum sp.]
MVLLIALVLGVSAALALFVNELTAYTLILLAFLLVSGSHPRQSEMELLAKAKQQIEQCEKELPRNQECELKAVPKI